ncbi:MAG TPA: hypothetical protein VJP77_07540, partial [Planctomycetota bacterium]|nr:hypothetical protein [Planctomycetota bacterium]
VAVGAVNQPTALFGVVIVPVPPLLVLPALVADGAGAASLAVPGADVPLQTLYVQAVAVLPGGIEASNALAAVVGAP